MAGPRAHPQNAPPGRPWSSRARRSASLLVLFTLVGSGVPGAAAFDGLPFLIGPSEPMTIPQEDLPAWLYTNGHDVAGGLARAEDATGAEVAQFPIARGHNVTRVPAVGEPDVEGDLSFRTSTETWVTWIPEARMVRTEGERLFIPCLEDRFVAYLWSVGFPDELRWLRFDGEEGAADGLEVFIFTGDPLKLISRGPVNVTYEVGLVQSGPEAFWVVARSAPGDCQVGVELVAEANRVVDDDTTFFFMFIIGAAAAIVGALIIIGIPKRLKVGPGALASTLVAAALVGGVAVEDVAAQSNAEPVLGPGSLVDAAGTVHRFSAHEGIGLVRDEGASRSFCIQGVPSTGREDAPPLSLHYEGRQTGDLAARATFPVPFAPDVSCFAGPKGVRSDAFIADEASQAAGSARSEVRLLVTEGRAIGLGAPGTVPLLDGVGGMVVVDSVASTGRIDVLLEVGWRATAFATSDLRELARWGSAGEHVALVDGADLAGGGVIVVLAGPGYDDGSSGHVQWVDPEWTAPAPSLGQIGVAVAAAMFVCLWRGQRPSVP